MAEGARAVAEVVGSRLTIRGALATTAFAESLHGPALLALLAGREIHPAIVSDAEFSSAADTDQPQGVLVVADIPVITFATIAASLPVVARLLLIDGVQEPGNVGALVRTAAAMGACAVVALPGTADLWNAKSVRGAAGALYRVPSLHASLEDSTEFLRAHDIVLWGTDGKGAPLGGITAPSRLALAVGNEGAGLSDAVRRAAASVVALPMSSDVESLNVVVAAGIILYALSP